MAVVGLDRHDLPSVEKVNAELNPEKVRSIGLVGPTVHRIAPLLQWNDKGEQWATL